MTKFSSIAHTSDGRVHIRHTEVSAFELRIGVKVLIGTGLIASAYYARDYMPVMMALALSGVGVLIATCVSTYLLLVHDIEAHRERTSVVPALPYEAPEATPPQTIAIHAHGATTYMTIDPKDDALVKLVLKLLDASIKLSSPDVTTFPTTRALGWPYADYDTALRALGIMVKRGRGVTPVLTFPHTLSTMREAIASGSLLPYRSDAPVAWNRIK